MKVLYKREFIYEWNRLSSLPTFFVASEGSSIISQGKDALELIKAIGI